MLNGKKVAGILLMAGSGHRFGGVVPKQFVMLAGKRVYLHTLEAFRRAGFFDELVLVCPEDWMEMVAQEAKGVLVVAGGKSRQESSYLGARAVSSDVVVIHDAVRPFVTERILRENALGAIEWGAVDTCIGSADTLVFAPGGGVIESIPKRGDYLRGQTPQSFRLDWILEAHEKGRGIEATDDCRLALEAGREVRVVMGEESNIKITTELDLYLAEQLFRLRLDGEPRGGGCLRGKRFGVVGGNGGIGRAVVEGLRREGAEGVVLSRSGKEFLDLRDAGSIERAFAKLGKLDGLINCAGKLVVKELAKMSLDEVSEILEVNLKGLILCCRAARLKEGAHVVNVASSSFTRGRKDYGVYSSAKAGVVNFTQALAEERPDLRVWSVIPQRTNTAMRKVNFPDEDRESLLDPDVVAETVMRVLKDPVSTGQLIEVRK